jgi:MSHA biogenesis protein MshN
MSVINQVLKDLDRQGANASTPNGVIAINQRAEAMPRWPWILIGVLGLASVAWWFWQKQQATVPPIAPALVLPPAAPQLRLSQQLSPVGEKSEAHPQAGNAASFAPPFPSARPAVPQPAPPTVAIHLPALKPRLDTRLSEPRIAEPVKSQVVKENKPQTPQTQAEDAWRQANRFLEQGRNHDAQDRLESALRLDPAHIAARQGLVALVLETGDSVRAEALLREGLALQPNDAWYSRSLAQLQLQRGDAVQAAATLKASLSKRADAANWGLYASTLAKLNRSEESGAAYREALRHDPSQGAWWVGLGVVLERSGNKAEAGDAYVRALQSRLSGELKEFAAQRAQALK